MHRAIRQFNLVRRLGTIALALSILYALAIAYITARQRHLIYRPRPELSLLPDHPDFGLTYEDVWIPVGESGHRLHGWWLPATAEDSVVLPDEPAQILPSSKVMLYLCGVGRNMG
ncbi:MAG: hypothetical protein AAF892_08615, partial [Cyanobacteria bacterium P01_D01_bin.71]